MPATVSAPVNVLAPAKDWVPVSTRPAKLLEADCKKMLVPVMVAPLALAEPPFREPIVVTPLLPPHVTVVQIVCEETPETGKTKLRPPAVKVSTSVPAEMPTFCPLAVCWKVLADIAPVTASDPAAVRTEPLWLRTDPPRVDPPVKRVIWPALPLPVTPLTALAA